MERPVSAISLVSGKKLFPVFSDHEEAWFWPAERYGFVAMIDIHNTNCGPALGGCRRRTNYADISALAFDVGRLGRGMTSKAAMTDYYRGGLPLGGGKAAMWVLDPTADMDAMYRSMGDFINAVNERRSDEYPRGFFFTGEDVGTKVESVKVMQGISPHVVGAMGNHPFAGDPSPYTALGVMQGLRGACSLVYNDPSLSGRRIYIEGIGNVGLPLLRDLYKLGAELWVSNLETNDSEREALSEARKLGAIVVRLDSTGAPAAFPEVEIYSPCALGATVNSARIAEYPSSLTIIGGSANNQLLDPLRDGELLLARNIFYCPDYVINNRGLWDIYHQLPWVTYDHMKILAGCEENAELIYNIGNRSRGLGVSPHVVAEEMAEAIWKLPYQ